MFKISLINSGGFSGLWCIYRIDGALVSLVGNKEAVADIKSRWISQGLKEAS
jgi:hypothetical protein